MTLHAAIARGVPGTTAPAFAQQTGGSLTEKQIDVLVEGMRSRWGKARGSEKSAFFHPMVSRMPSLKAGLPVTHGAAQLHTRLIARSATVKMAVEVPKADP